MINKIPELFQNKNKIRRKSYQRLGDVSIYTGRDKNLGKCYFHKDGFITPNMPKLFYAFDFFVNLDDKIEIKGLSRNLPENSKVYIYEKRDGFNCLFYEYDGKIIPKTRMNPIARGMIMSIINLPQFPIKRIERMVRDGYIPIFEVWGSKLDKVAAENFIDHVHGSIDMAKVEEAENLPELNVDLIAVMKIKNNKYKYMSPSFIEKIANNYRLHSVKYHGYIDVTYDKLIEIMDGCQKVNEEAQATITEGRVLHSYLHGEYRMFKLKPMPIMEHDVVQGKTIPMSRIELEISKILLENSINEIIKNPIEHIKEVIKYLSEDFIMINKFNRKVSSAFIDIICKEYVKENSIINIEELYKVVHPSLIGKIKQIIKYNKEV